MKGIIKSYNADGWYGFISVPDDGEPDLYFNKYGFKEPDLVDTLQEGQAVEFDTVPFKEEMKRAINIVYYEDIKDKGAIS